MAKEISMIQRSEKGKMARQYFIDCEKKLKEQQQDKNQYKLPQTYLEALKELVVKEEQNQILLVENTELKETLEIQTPKAEAFDMLMNSDKLYSFQEGSSLLGFKGLGQNNLFKLLKERKILMGNNLPYRKYLEHEYFKVIEEEFTKGNVNFFREKTLITNKGLRWLLNGLLNLGYVRLKK